MNEKIEVNTGNGEQLDEQQQGEQQLKEQQSRMDQPLGKAMTETVGAENEALDSELEEALQSMFETKDRYGNGPSEESKANLLKFMAENPEGFLQEVQARSEGQAKARAEMARAEGYRQGYQGAQDELATLLDGRTAEEFLRTYDFDMAHFTEQLAEEQAKLENTEFQTPKAREFQERKVQETQEILADMRREYNLVARSSGNQEIEAALPPEVEPEVPTQEEVAPEQTEVKAENVGTQEEKAEEKAEEEHAEEHTGENEQNRETANSWLKLKTLNVKGALYNVKRHLRRGAIEKIVQFLTDDAAEVALVALRRQEDAEENLRKQDDFAEMQSGEPTEEEIAQTAEAEEQRKRAYRQAMVELARESKPGRFDQFDPELPHVSPKVQEKAATDTVAQDEYYQKMRAWAAEEAKHPNRFGDVAEVPVRAQAQKAEQTNNTAERSEDYSALDSLLTEMLG